MFGHSQIELEGGHRLICYFKIFLSFCFYWLRRSLFPLVTFPPIICLIFYLNFVCFVQNLPERRQIERNKNFATSLYAWVKLPIFLRLWTPVAEDWTSGGFTVLFLFPRSCVHTHFSFNFKREHIVSLSFENVVPCMF